MAKVSIDISTEIKKLSGPILILGGSGFVGANLFKQILKVRKDVFAVASRLPAWRLEDVPTENIIATDLLVEANCEKLFTELNPQTIFNCVAFGAYSFEKNADQIYLTNFNLTAKILSIVQNQKIACYVHAGSSSEYGENSAGPTENQLPLPNSDYSVSKTAAANAILHYGKQLGVPCCNLRLYSIFGPMEDSSRFLPAVIREGFANKYPPFVNPKISRDFVYVDDCCAAFILAAIRLRRENYGESFNIGSGEKITVENVANLAKIIFSISEEPIFNSMDSRSWDLEEWFSDSSKAQQILGWKASTPFEAGLLKMADWYNALPDKIAYEKNSKKYSLDYKFSVSIVLLASSLPQQTIEVFEQVRQVILKMNLDHEFILVDDRLAPDTEKALEKITAQNSKTRAVLHSRSFGRQASIMSGFQLVRKRGCVLIDAQAGEPIDLIPQFVEKWREGYAVVYGNRKNVSRTWLGGLLRPFLVKLFDRFSYLPIPLNSSDYCLLDTVVVQELLKFRERAIFFRGIRSYVGFKQIGIDYDQAQNRAKIDMAFIIEKIGLARGGLLSFSNTPITILSFVGTLLLLLSVGLGLFQIVARLMIPDWTPKGFTTVVLLILFFGSVNLMAVGLIGEYVSRIFDEVKGRPQYIRDKIYQNGEGR